MERKFAADITYKPIPKFPAVVRDLAVVVDEDVTCAQLTDCILRACKAAKKAELFDVFRGPRLGVGKKSMAMHITFVPEGDKPIAPENADAFFKKILSSLEKNFGASLR